MSELDSGVIVAIGKDKDTDTPSAWIGCLSCYNSGRLFGKWIAGLECNDLVSAGLATLETVGDYTANRCVRCFGDEFAALDHENFLGLISGECSPVEAYEAALLISELDESEYEKFAAWISNGMAKDIDKMRECYIGEFSSDTELGEYYADETGLLSEMPESLRRYFDYEAYGRDLAHDTFESGGFYFWSR